MSGGYGRRNSLAMDIESQLEDVFVAFAALGQGQEIVPALTSKNFYKLCSDCGLLSKRLTKTDVDLMFTRVKLRGQNKIAFETFRRALRLVAEKKGNPYHEVVEQVITAGGPVLNATMTEQVRFHDDKTTYTGAAAQGGHTTVDRNNVTLDSLLNREDADVRGVNRSLSKQMPYGEKPISRVGSRNFPDGRKDYEDEYSEKASKAQLYEEKQMELSTAMSQQLRKLFHTFCARGSTNMDSARFLKLLRDCRIIGDQMISTDADLIFQKAKRGGNYAKTIDYEAFRDEALPRIADKLHVDIEIVARNIITSQGPTWSGTQAEHNRFHDDKNTYTGVHARGGPTVIDNSISLSTLADRTDADVRGVKQGVDYTNATVGVGSLPTSTSRGALRMAPRDAGIGKRIQRDFSSEGIIKRDNSSDSRALSRVARQLDRPSSNIGRQSSRGRRGPGGGGGGAGGGVYDRLTNVDSYTGVYKKRFEGGPDGGRINGDTINTVGARYTGHTNQSSDSTIRDISQILRR